MLRRIQKNPRDRSFLEKSHNNYRLIWHRLFQDMVFMSDCIRTLTQQSRSTRRFQEDHLLSRDQLTGLIDIARFCPSARNRQPLRYIISVDPDQTHAICSLLLWALDLPEWDGPVAGERPPAYITILASVDCSPDPAIDLGIAAQTILLAAAEEGIAGCIFGSVQKSGLRRLLQVPAEMEILLVVALGYPAEEIRLEPLPPNGDTRYWRSPDGIHHVPKRALEDCIIHQGEQAD